MLLMCEQMVMSIARMRSMIRLDALLAIESCGGGVGVRKFFFNLIEEAAGLD